MERYEHIFLNTLGQAAQELPGSSGPPRSTLHKLNILHPLQSHAEMRKQGI